MTKKVRWYIIGASSLYVWGHLTWDYFHGGVPGHHLLAREDLPWFSNWWGAITIPLLTWFLTFRIQQRLSNSGQRAIALPASVIYTFLFALGYGALLSACFVFDVQSVPGYMLLGLLAASLLFPIYRAEFFLGMVIGLLQTFGGVLPIFIVTILSLTGVVVYRLLRPALLFIVNKVRKAGVTRP